MGTLCYGECWRTATVHDIRHRYLKNESVETRLSRATLQLRAELQRLLSGKGPSSCAQGLGCDEQPGKVSDVVQAFYTFLGGNDMMAYLTMMSARLVELRRVLKPTGSLYLHCDPTASHCLKQLCEVTQWKSRIKTRSELS